MGLKGVFEEMERIKNEFMKTRSEILEKQVRSMKRDLEDATPVKTGRARDSWEIQHNANPDVPLTVVNTVPYIQELNAGSSKQAPPFFIDKIALRYGKPVGAIVKVVDNPET